MVNEMTTETTLHECELSHPLDFCEVAGKLCTCKKMMCLKCDIGDCFFCRSCKSTHQAAPVKRT